MEVTEVKVKLMSDKTDRLLAFCSVTLDNEFVIRDLKIIEGTRGRFVAMPSRKLADKCPKCGGKNHLRAAYCNDCGGRLNPDRASQDERGRAKLHADIAHPINQNCRERMQAAIIEAYEQEVDRAKEPGYTAPDLEEYEFDKVSTFFEEEKPGTPSEAAAEPATAAPEPAPAPTPAEPEPEPAQAPQPAPPSPPKPAPEAQSEEKREDQEEKPQDDFTAGIF